MKNSYLLSLIKTINPEEWPELNLFVSSVYHNRGPYSIEVQKLLALIESTSPNYNPDDLDKMRSYKILFPDKPYIEGKIEKVMAELNKIIRTFLLSKSYFDEVNYFNKTFDLAKILRERELEARYRQTISGLDVYLEKEEHRIQDYFHKKYLLEYEKHDWQSYYNRQKSDINLTETIRNLDLFYYINKFELLNRFLLQKMSIKLETPEFIAQLLEDTNLPEYYKDASPKILITNKILLLLNSKKPSTIDFDELTALINKHEDKIDFMSLRTFCAYLRNICVLLYYAGLKEFEPLLFKLQKEHLEKGYLYYHGKLHASTFHSAVSNGIRQKEYDWVIKFIEDNKNLIIGDNDTKDYYRLNLALYFTSVKRFKHALDSLPQSFTEPIYNYLARRLELKIYYETNSILLVYKIDSFKMLINRTSRKQLSPQEWENQHNFINLLYQIAQFVPKDKNRSERLIKRINSKKFVADREWLLEKAAELGRKK